MNILEGLARDIESRKMLIAEIEEMLEVISMTEQNRDLAKYTIQLLKDERLQLIAKAATLQNLHFYREMKEENDLSKGS